MRALLGCAVLAVLLWSLAPQAAASAITLTATPSEAHIGDVIHLSGTVTGVNTIAVYLFLMGPDLDARGVTLENLNIPAGRGLFTTAPVNLTDRTWEYTWDTSVILGNLKPGHYTVYVVSSPIDKLRFEQQDFATAEISFNPPVATETPLPLPALVPLGAVAIAGMLCIALTRNKA